MLQLLLAFGLFACGSSKNDSKPESRRDPICENGILNTLCLPAAIWTIESSAVNFPTNYALSIEGSELMDTCDQEPNGVTVETNSAGRKLLKLGYLNLPGRDLSIQIVDRGVNCDNNAVFHQEDSATYSVATVTIENRKTHYVYVSLNN